MILYHYSSKKLKEINPKYFSKNYFTANDKKISNIKRSFFYDKKQSEYLLNDCDYIHIVKINSKNIYDLTKDKNKLLIKFKNDIDKTLRYLKSKNKIVKYNLGYNVYNIFNTVKVNSITINKRG